jgi:hypothetical protein
MRSSAHFQADSDGVDGIATGKALLQSGQDDAARALLERRLARDPRDVEALFLLGLIALGAGDHRLAIARFRQALVHVPDATRIRLELARAFYLDRDYENAFRQFQFARAGNPPPQVIAAIDRFLSAIRREKSWSYSFSVAIAPDTNINNATSARETDLFGLPFELGEQARRRSGIGIALGGSAEVAPRISSTTRLRLGVAAQRREYDGRRFDDTSLALLVGPRMILKRWDLGVAATGFRRWFGGRRLNEGYGLRGEATRYLDARTALSFDVSAQRIRYPHMPAQSGTVLTGSAGLVRALTAASSVSARIGIARQDARAGDLSSWSWFGRIGYYRDLPGGFSVYAEPGIARSTFDAADPFTGKTRRDMLYEMQLSLLNRRIILFSRFTPRISYTFARRQSSVDLYRFTQHRVEAGITSAF